MRYKQLTLLTALLVLLAAGSVLRAAVELDFFVGAWQRNDTEVRLVFQTGSEIDHSWFDIWRSTSNLPIVAGDIDRTQAIKVNSQQILNPSGACQSTGHLYEYIDRSVDSNVDTYYYYLESYNCSNASSEMNGDGSNGLRISQGGTPTFTPSPTPSETAVPGQPTNTPTASETAVPGQPTATVGAGSPTATATAGGSPSPRPTGTVSPTARPSATPRPSATSQPSATVGAAAPAPPTRTPFPTVYPGYPPGASFPGQSPPAVVPGLSPTPTLDPLAFAITDGNPSSAAAIGGEMSARVIAPTPTVAPRAVRPARGPDAALVAAVVENDPLDRLMRALIGLILALIVALIGYLGWTYARQ